MVLAAASCQLLSFLAVAARARIDLLAYPADDEEVMPDDDRPVGLTHRECAVANSLRTQVDVEPRREFSGRVQP